MIKHLAGKTIFISGASRGIGLSIALRAARDGANVIIAAKTADPHPKLPGTIYTAAKEIEEAGGQCLPCVVDIRHEDQVQRAMEDGAKKFGGIDILINNASAISLTGTLETPMKKYDLMNQVNARGTYLCSRLALPYLKLSKNPHILNLSPPLSLNPKWFKNHVAYTMAKYGMSMCVLGMAEEFKDDGIAVNALWPRTAIETAAIDLIAGDEMRKQCRKADIMADAAYVILTRNSREKTGQFLVDESVLRETGVSNFDKYSVVPGNPLMIDFFLDEEEVVSKLEDNVKKVEPQQQATPQQSNLDLAFASIKNLLSADLVKQIQSVYAFNFSDNTPSEFYLDLKNGNGDIGEGAPKLSKASCTMNLKAEDFVKMASGQLKPTTAFMTGKLKIKGDMGAAMKLEKVLLSIKKTEPPKPDTAAKPASTPGSAPAAPASTSNASQSNLEVAFSSIKKLLSPDLVKQIQSVYAFNFSDHKPSEWYLDLKNGNGDIGEGAPKLSKASCTMTLKAEDFVKMASGQLKPTTAFMTGKLKIKGDMGAAMKLEKVLLSVKSKL